MTPTANLSVQESLYPELNCFGCGHANSSGFQLRSYAKGDVTVAEVTPGLEHDNGFGFLNGGITATVLDCHGAAALAREVVERGWTDAAGMPVPFVTASFTVTFHRPTPLGPTLQLVSWPESVDPSRIIVTSEIALGEKVGATMQATWARFRDRS